MRRIYLAVVVLLLTSCASLPPSPTPTSVNWPQRQQLLHQITAWQLVGAIAIADQQQRTTATLHWQQTTAMNYHLQLVGPMGINSLLLDVTPIRAILTVNNQQFFAATPEELLQQQTGLQLPIAPLYYWIRGLPAPGTVDDLRFDQHSQLQQLVQQGWQLRFLSYMTVNDISLPREIILKHDQLVIKLIITQWKTN